MTASAPDVEPVPDPVPLHRSLGLTDDELEGIRERLGRQPNDLELAMFSVMWSEHCSYKSSRPLLATLPTAGRDVVAGPGENAGVISIGDGLAVAFKIESHNHPSSVEPYQGAATGVGGILRDIFTMGARPIAVLDALRFGDPGEARTRHLVDGVVRGVGGYGNCVGVPTVGGELVFDSSYAGNPLVNVMAIGLLDERHLTRAAAPGPGNLAVLFGSATGRDGIGGASVLASATFGDADGSKRPSVQVGDPFAEKLLIEASLELIEQGLVEGLQDLGAAGITCATSETADRAGTGIRVDLDAIPRREPGMEPFEVMISESQERMLAIVRPDRVAEVAAVCERWGLGWAVIGEVSDDGYITVVEAGRELARIPAAAARTPAGKVEDPDSMQRARCAERLLFAAGVDHERAFRQDERSFRGEARAGDGHVHRPGSMSRSEVAGWTHIEDDRVACIVHLRKQRLSGQERPAVELDDPLQVRRSGRLRSGGLRQEVVVRLGEGVVVAALEADRRRRLRAHRGAAKRSGDVTREDLDAVAELDEPSQGMEELFGAVLRLDREIGPCGVADEQGVAREHKPRLVAPGAVDHRERAVLRTVARCVDRANEDVAELDLGSVDERLVRKRGLCGRVDAHGQLVLERQPPVAGDVVGVGVGLEHPDELHAAVLTGIQIPLDRVGRIDHDGDARVLVTDDVRPTAEVVVDELHEQHEDDASNGCGYIS